MAAKNGSPDGDKQRIDLRKVEFEEMTFRIVGTAPLVVHRFGTKAIGGIRSSQGIGAKLAKAPKDPVADFLDTLYRPNITDEVVAVNGIGKKASRIEKYELDVYDEGLHPVWATFEDGTWDRFCFPAHSIREAMGSASMAFGLTPDIVSVRRLLSVSRIMVPIESKAPPQMLFMVADVQGKPDLRFRAQFTDWAMTHVVRYPKQMTNVETILNLIRLAGLLAGIGEMRPEKKIGSYGQFVLDPKSVVVKRIVNE